MSGAILGARAGVRSLVGESAHPTTALARLMRGVLSSLAEFERALIRSRSVEDRQRAVAPAGVRLGSRSKLSAHGVRQAKTRRRAG